MSARTRLGLCGYAAKRSSSTFIHSPAIIVIPQPSFVALLAALRTNLALNDRALFDLVLSAQALRTVVVLNDRALVNLTLNSHEVANLVMSEH